MSALDDLRNKRGIHTPAEACILLAGESTIANEAAAELASLRSRLDAQTAALEAALSAAVTALYFNDNNDFGTALWLIVSSLGGADAESLLINDEEAAYHKYVKRGSDGKK